MTTKKAAARRLRMAPKTIETGIAGVLARTASLAGVHDALPSGLAYARAAEEVATPLLAGFGVVGPKCEGIDFYALLDNMIANLAGAGIASADMGSDNYWIARIDAAYFLGIAIGMQLGGR